MIEVTDVLRGVLQPQDVDNIQIDKKKTVVICITRDEYKINDLCINRIDRRECV